MNYENLPVYKATFDLLLMVYRRTPRMQRDYRYTLGEEAKRALQEVISCIYQANLRDEGKLVYIPGLSGAFQGAVPPHGEPAPAFGQGRGADGRSGGGRLRAVAEMGGLRPCGR